MSIETSQTDITDFWCFEIGILMISWVKLAIIGIFSSFSAMVYSADCLPEGNFLNVFFHIAVEVRRMQWVQNWWTVSLSRILLLTERDLGWCHLEAILEPAGCARPVGGSDGGVPWLIDPDRDNDADIGMWLVLSGVCWNKKRANVTFYVQWSTEPSYSNGNLSFKWEMPYLSHP